MARLVMHHPMSGFNKHKWLDAVEDDARITPSEARVLLRIGRRYVLNGDSTFRVQQTTLATRCRVDVRTVRRAITKGKDLGYLALAQERKRGRSHRAPDQYRLVMPDRNTGQNSGQNTGQNGAEIPDSTPGNTGQPTIEIADKANPSTSENATTTVFTTVLKETGTPDTSPADSEPVPTGPDPSGGDPPENNSTIQGEPFSVTAARPEIMALPRPPANWPDDYPEPEPARFCHRHPDDTTDRCVPCRDARRKHDAWEAARAQWRKDLAAAKRAWVEQCRECESEGWFLGRDGLPVDDPAFKCHHARIWWEWWEHRLAAPTTACKATA